MTNAPTGQTVPVPRTAGAPKTITARTSHKSLSRAPRGQMRHAAHTAPSAKGPQTALTRRTAPKSATPSHGSQPESKAQPMAAWMKKIP